MKKTRYLWLAIIAIFAVAFAAFAQTEATTKSTESTVTVTKTSENVIAYPLDYCVISNEKLGKMGDPVVKVYDGREVKFCCNMCVKTFEKDKVKGFKKIDDAVAAAQKPAYPLETCVVTGEKLGKMGDPVDYVYNNRLVRFCCKGCIPTFKKDPAKYLAMIDAAFAPKTDAPAAK
jgi:YHS domain-containing protein